MSKNIGKIIRVNSLPPKGERLTNVIYQVAVPETATYIDYAVDENGDIKTPTLDKSLAENDFSKVKTVNNAVPDEQGNIDLNDYVQIYNSEEELQEIWDNGIRDKIYFNHQTKDMVIGHSDGDGYSLFKMNEYLDKPVTRGTDQDYPYVVVVDKEGNSAKRDLEDFGKVKTVNGEEPDEFGNIEFPEKEFVKTTFGYGLSKRKESVGKYIDTTNKVWSLGESTFDFSLTNKTDKEYGGDANISQVLIGTDLIARGAVAVTLGYSNTAGTQGSVVLGMHNSVTRTTSSGNNSSAILSGRLNEIVDCNETTVVGISNIVKNMHRSFVSGMNNNIDIPNNLGNDVTAGTVPQLNSIFGFNNHVIINTSNNLVYPTYSFINGSSNTVSGRYQFVHGYNNEAVSVGETIVGLHATIQDKTKYDGHTYYPDSRLFAVGVGLVENNNTLRKDGLNVYRNGLVTVPTITNSLINNNPKAVVTKEYIDSIFTSADYIPLTGTEQTKPLTGLIKTSTDQSDMEPTNKLALAQRSYVDAMQTKPTNWTNEVQRMPALPDKTVDATYNNVVVIDGMGNLGTSFLLGNRSDMSSIAIGFAAKAENVDSLALGNSTKSVGLQSSALGNNAESYGDYSTALGYYTRAESYASTVIGRNAYSRPGQSRTAWVGTEDLLIVGNAKEGVTRANALELLKNGLLKLPDVTNSLIEGSPKSVITKEYLDTRIPKPPSTGNYVLKSSDGIISWMSE